MGDAREVSPAEFFALDFSQVTLVDVREPRDRALQGALAGSVDVPLSQLGGLSRVPQGKPVYVYCVAGLFSGEVVELLRERGYDAHDVAGGFRALNKWALEAEGVLASELVDADG